MSTPKPVVIARDLELRTSRGRVFGPVSLEAPEGSVTAVLGASGCGKTALLLALTGRMRPSRGAAAVCGHDISREASKVRRLAALGLFDGVNDLELGLTARQHVAEQKATVGRSRRTDEDVLAACGLGRAARRRVRDLTAEERIRLGVALALVGRPRLIAIDDLDRNLTSEQVAAVGETLRALAEDGLTVLVSCLDERSAAFADSVVWATAPISAAEEGARAIA